MCSFAFLTDTFFAFLPIITPNSTSCSTLLLISGIMIYEFGPIIADGGFKKITGYFVISLFISFAWDV